MHSFNVPTTNFRMKLKFLSVHKKVKEIRKFKKGGIKNLKNPMFAAKFFRKEHKLGSYIGKTI